MNKGLFDLSVVAERSLHKCGIGTFSRLSIRVIENRGRERQGLGFWPTVQAPF